MNKIKIAITEDFRRFREGLKMAFRHYDSEIEIIFDAENGAEMITKLDPNNLPQVMLMDLQMPVMDGFDATRWLNTHHPQIRILILTTHTDEKFITYMLEIGAHGYLFKNAEPSEIRKAILEVNEKGYSINFVVEHILQKKKENKYSEGF